MEKITPKQIKKIHTLKTKLKMTDEEYRLRLSDYWVSTSKDLTYEEAEDFIQKLEKEAIEKILWTPHVLVYYRYEDIERVHGMATPRQLRMIEAMWKDVSYLRDETKRLKALRKFVYRITGTDNLRELTFEQARKVINAIMHMKRR
ncbi:regulatory protein GemA [Thermodesulfovibrio sp.]|uniref:regulatory protein GemA n=1 Tax=Thermodesulfovibrio sp. TaxID=2067987 RepID=UPI0030ADA221